MNYDDRIAFLKEWFKADILTRFNMPKDLDPKVVAMDLIEAINRNIPNNINQELMSHLSASIAKEVAQSARSRTLPTVKDFLDAAKKAAKSGVEPHTEPARTSMDPYALAAQRIRSGAPVSDTYLKGPSRKKLQELQGVTDLELEPYLKTIHNTAHKQ